MKYDLAQIASFGAAGCYVVASISLLKTGHYWLVATLSLYAITCVTTYFAGTH